MIFFKDLSILLAIFTIVCLASKQIGFLFRKFHFPVITGYLITGIIAGPDILELIKDNHFINLKFVDEVSLAFIAFAAGCELHLEEIKSHFKAIIYITIGLILSTFTFATISIVLLSGYIPFMAEMSFAQHIGVAILAGAILIARSPSAAIAIIKELRAKGPFTKITMGVTVVLDFLVIVIFSLNSSVASAIFSNKDLDFSFMIHISIEMISSIIIGLLIGRAIKFIVKTRYRKLLKSIIILLTGYFVFILNDYLTLHSAELIGFEIKLEPLLICMISSFWLINFTNFRNDFEDLLDNTGPVIYVAFFTLTGASMNIEILSQVWKITLILFFTRILGIVIGSVSGGFIAGLPGDHIKYKWMAFITQAGVGLGLAKSVGVNFPEWGQNFATLIISVIILNEIIGPLFYKWSLFFVKEAHPKAKKSDQDTVHSTIIFGSETQSLALAQQLHTHDWQVKIVCPNVTETTKVKITDIEINPLPEINLEELNKLGCRDVGAIITLMSDEENLKICEIAYEHFGRANLITLVSNRINFDKFHELGVFVVSPSTAIISLLDHVVRAPSAVSLLLGYEDNMDIIDVEMQNDEYSGKALREIALPDDVQILAIHRNNSLLNIHGYIRFQSGDIITVIGSNESLELVEVNFSAD